MWDWVVVIPDRELVEMPSPPDGNMLSCGPLIEAHLLEELRIKDANRFIWEPIEVERDPVRCTHIYKVRIGGVDEDIRTKTS